MPVIQTSVDLTPFNTLGLPARASHFVCLTSVAEIAALRADATVNRLPWRVLGGGSNLWLAGDLDALVIKVEIPGKRLVREDDEAVYVAAGGGEDWHGFVQWTLAQGWGGLENLALIPGTVGAALGSWPGLSPDPVLAVSPGVSLPVSLPVSLAVSLPVSLPHPATARTRSSTRAPRGRVRSRMSMGR